MSDLQRQARALGDPTRHRIFRLVADAAAPIDVAALTAAIGLNHNAIRQHLAKLVDAGLVVEDRASGAGRGRPRLVYRAHPSADSRWGVTGPYERLSVLLAELLRTGETAVEVGRRAAGRHPVRPSPAEASVADISVAMAREGFAPEVVRGPDGVDVVLTTCPFASAVLADPQTVCALHLGLAEGLAGRADDVTVAELDAKDPRRAHCRLHLVVGTTPG